MPILASGVFVCYCLYGDVRAIYWCCWCVCRSVWMTFWAKLGINEGFYERGIHLEIADMN